MTSARGPRFASLLRLALRGGRADALRIVLTAVGSAFASFVLLLAAAVISIGPHDGPYTTKLLSEPGLHPGVVVAMIAISALSLSFVGQCSRVGAPARDRRLAAMRMAGGTPRDVRTVLALEVCCAAALGSVVAASAYLVIHRWFSTGGSGRGFQMGEQTADHAHLLPTDVLPHPVLLVMVLLAVPAGASLLGLLALRRTALTPFGVIRRVIHRPPAIAPVIVFLIGAIGLIGWSAIPARLYGSQGAFLLLITAFFLCTGIGLVLGSAACALHLGRLGAAHARRPAALIACRRMVAAPFTASRACAAVVVSVLIGAAAQGVRADFLLRTAGNDDPFYANAFDLVDVVLAVAIAIAVAGLLVVAAEGVVARRRTLAALVASGVPRRTLATATLLEMVAPLVPTVLIATTTGVLAARGVYGSSATVYVPSTPVPAGGAGQIDYRPVIEAIPVPWAALATVAGGALLLAAAVTLVSLLFLRRSTDLAELRAA
ncbi:FtsX-like permease family protein [Allobranchiibius huperziae]|uniref:ABC3 transporter permease C-terminal domain-containing protein n=1 Tax=Allobranchiibius huperziae TaxID=1874116 RepID=A0A853DF36_9MICO|nr:FtsX-like permease family protein [Allobranchiibius huperziae]NYJ76102.1 hypothetical protein [Allobranchiibius huperziae]